MTPTDTQLKQALAKMLPDLLENYYQDTPLDNFLLSWKQSKREVLDTELLHLCWLVEQTLDVTDRLNYLQELQDAFHFSLHYPTQAILASWQQRVIALAKVKGIEIV